MSAASGQSISITRPIEALLLLLTDERYFWYLGILTLLGDAVLTQLVIRFVGCEYRSAPFPPHYAKLRSRHRDRFHNIPSPSRGVFSWRKRLFSHQRTEWASCVRGNL